VRNFAACSCHKLSAKAVLAGTVDASPQVSGGWHRESGLPAVLGDPVGRQHLLAGTEQPDTGSAVAIGHSLTSSPSSVGARDPRRPVTRQNRAFRGEPGPQPGTDELAGRCDALRGEQDPARLREHAGPVIHGMRDVAVAPSSPPVRPAHAADELAAATREDGQVLT
jgi:hypothetical protein